MTFTLKWDYVVCSIEESKDIDVLSLDELQSSLLVHEQKMNRSSSSEEQALKASTFTHSSSSSSRGRGWVKAEVEVEVEAKAEVEVEVTNKDVGSIHTLELMLIIIVLNIILGCLATKKREKH